MVSLKTTVAGIPLECCIYNASGPRTGSAAALNKIAMSKAGGVLAKSATIMKQIGNPQPRTWQSTDASLNSEGLPNAGIEYYVADSTIQESMGHSGKPYMISISGKTLEDNVEMIKRIIECNNETNKIACLELNLACPNIIGKPIIAYDFDQLKTVLKAVAAVPGIEHLVLGVKMPPYFDGVHFKAAASVINEFKHIVKYVATINTIGNALAIDSIAEMPMISSNGGFAGLSGKAVKYTALANVRQMRVLLEDTIDVVGVGGVETGEDVFEFLLCGATAVQVGTCHWREGPSCFDRIHNELVQIMEQKGYSSIQEFKGKLKDWNKEGANTAREARKAQKQDTPNVVQASRGGGLEIAMTANALLVVIIAWLLADKYGIVSF